jgi:predicted nucleic acid-binding protein
MIVFSNTTPIIALSSVQCLHLLPQLFGEIHLVNEVIDECAVGGPIRVPVLQELDWVKPVQSTPIQFTSVLLELDKGEKHTLDMAYKYQADWVIIDEKRLFGNLNGCKKVIFKQQVEHSLKVCSP